MAAAFALPALAQAQNYPTKPVRIVTTAPGNAFDIATRLIADRLGASLGQPFIVDNRGGAGGSVAGTTVARAQPDGYTLLSYGPAMYQIVLLAKDVPYDPQNDFAPITLVLLSPNVMVVHPSVPVNSVKELIALARAKPGQINYGAGDPGSSLHLAGEQFKAITGINMVGVPYKSTVQTVNALLAGEVQVTFPNVAAAMPHIKDGKVKVLAVCTSRAFPLLPNVPTMPAAGVAGFESAAMLGIYAPAKTPAAIINRLNQEVVKALAAPEVKDRLLNLGAIVVGSNPEELAARLKSEMDTTGKLIKALGIKAQ